MAAPLSVAKVEVSGRLGQCGKHRWLEAVLTVHSSSRHLHPVGSSQVIVHVFILRAANDSKASLLLLPDVPKSTVPPHLRAADWKYLLTTSTDDDLVGGSSMALEKLLRRDGYMLFQALTPVDRACWVVEPDPHHGVQCLANPLGRYHLRHRLLRPAFVRGFLS